LQRQISELNEQIDEKNNKIVALDEQNREHELLEEELRGKVALLEERLKNKRERYNVEI